MTSKKKGKGVKNDKGKPQMDLLPGGPLLEISRVLSHGADEYGRFNWREGFAWSRTLSAAMRHLNAFNAGIDKDPDTGLSHLAHCACNLLFLLEFEKSHPELDDRYKPHAKKTRTKRK